MEVGVTIFVIPSKAERNERKGEKNKGKTPAGTGSNPRLTPLYL